MPRSAPSGPVLLRLDIFAILESYQRSLIAKSLCRNVKEGREGWGESAERLTHEQSWGYNKGDSSVFFSGLGVRRWRWRWVIKDEARTDPGPRAKAGVDREPIENSDSASASVQCAPLFREEEEEGRLMINADPWSPHLYSWPYWFHRADYVIMKTRADGGINHAPLQLLWDRCSGSGGLRSSINPQPPPASLWGLSEEISSG